MSELSIIQKTYDLIKWYIPIINRFPQVFKFQLGDRIISRLYDFLETLLSVQYKVDKLNDLMQLNQSLVVLRYQARLLLDFEIIDLKRYDNIIIKLSDIGTELGGWIKQQTKKQKFYSNSHETLR
ncbi:MAG: diversity-generating retroelement protein Avd [Prochlorotrichaceae cyanobacterium]|jgi:hypothetical protein